MRLYRLPGVFQPHSDSWLLAEQLGAEARGEDSRVLDLCTGSGIVAIAAARMHARVTAVDVSRWAVLMTWINARLNRLTVRTRRGDLFDAVRGESFDLILSNPPYLPTPAPKPARHRASRAWEAGLLGRTFIDRICADAPAHLRPHGALLIVHSSICGEQETLDAMSQAGLRATVIARRRGPLGPRLRARADWLAQRGLLPADGHEEMLVIRGSKT